MLKFYTSIFALTMALSLNAGTFEIEETFDDASHFTASSKVPDGWSVGTDPYSRQSTLDAGYQAKSGTYLFGYSAPNGGVFFTPLKEVASGQPYKIEFSTALPAGTTNWWTLGLTIYASQAQTTDNMIEIGRIDYQQISDWRDLSFTYTPATDGEWCFAIKADRLPAASYAPNCGAAWFDDFFITGTAPGAPDLSELEPDPDNLENCIELPYKETFSDPTHYEEGNGAPDGWVVSGSSKQPWATANLNSLPAQEGDYYMIAIESSYERDERLYTPYFNLVAGREYTITFYTHFDGYLINGEPRTSTLKFTAGIGQEADLQPVTLYTVSRGLDDTREWVRETVSFTPAVDGPYCFAIMLEGPAYCGWVAVDSFNIGSAYDLPRPEPSFTVGGIYNWSDNALIAFGDEAVSVTNISNYSDSYEWTSDATLTTTDGGHATLSFPATGVYNVSLAATNARGTRTAVKDINVTRLDEEKTKIPMLHYNPAEITVIDRGNIPSWDTDENRLDYVSGFNHYYHTLAQRYDLPATGTVRPVKLLYFLANLRYAAQEGPDAVQQYDEPFALTIYGSDARGNIDPTRVLYRKETKMHEVFGYQFIGGSTAAPNLINFDPDVELSGTVYLAFEFSENMQLVPKYTEVGRSFFSLSMTRGRQPESTFYVKASADLPSAGISAGEWHPINHYSAGCSGLGLNLVLYADYQPGDASGITDAGDDGAEAFTATVTADGHIMIAGARDYVTIHTVDGRRVTGVAADGTVTIDLGTAGSGIYIATTRGAAAKFVKH